MVAGSISPDTGYLFSGFGLDVFSHDLLRGTVFGVLAGLALLAVYCWAGPRVLRWLASPYQETLRPLLKINFTLAWPVILSLALGVWSHLLLDSLTHSEGWLSRHTALLQATLFTFHNHSIRVCHLLWYGFSFLGIAWLVLAARKWLEEQRDQGKSVKSESHLLEALLAAALILPIELIHHLVHSRFALVLVAVLSLGGMAVVLGRMTRDLCSPRAGRINKWKRKEE